jgi:hypothetical protein
VLSTVLGAVRFEPFQPTLADLSAHRAFLFFVAPVGEMLALF